jgi:DNA primase
MDISEQVLLNTLAQLIQKDISEANKQFKQEQKAFEVVKNESQIAQEKINVVFELERKIIEILLLYGNHEEQFEDVILKTNEDGELMEVVEKKDYKVFQRIFLSLQEDEIELANPLFKEIYEDLIEKYNQEEFNREHYFQQLSPEFSQVITDILMQDEKEVLHNWETKHIYVKQKDQTIAQYVSETIISLREYLINKLIVDLMQAFTPETQEQELEEIKNAINDYNKLKVVLTNKIGRIRSTYY